MVNKKDKVKDFLKVVGMPSSQQTDLCSYVILALSGIKPKDKWSKATNDWYRIHDIIAFTAENYNVVYAVINF